MAVIAITALAYAQSTGQNSAQSSPLILNAKFADKGKLKTSITCGDTLTILTCKKVAGSKTIPSGAFTYRVKSFENGIQKGVATFPTTTVDSCCKIKPSTTTSKGGIRLPTTALYCQDYPVEDDTLVAMVYAKKIYFVQDGKRQYPALILPIDITEVLSKKILEEMLVRYYISAILMGNKEIVMTE